MTPGQSDLAACLQTAAMLYLNSPPEAPVTCTQDIRNLNDYNSDRINNSSDPTMDITSSTSRICGGDSNKVQRPAWLG